MTIQLPKSDIMLSSAPLIREHTNDLKPLGITMFSYARAYDDGSFIDMSDRPDMIDYYYYQTDIYKHYTPDAQPETIGDGYFILTSAEIANSPLAPVQDDINLDNSFSIIKKGSGFHEVWNYATYKNNHAILNFYLNNIAYLESFSLNFKEKMGDLISRFEQDRIIRTLPEANNVIAPIKIQYNPFDLSPRQQQCADLLIEGKSTKEIALALELSPRTVELYINNMKIKLGCRNKAELIVKLLHPQVLR